MNDKEKIEKLRALIGSVVTTMMAVHRCLPEDSRNALKLELSYAKIEQVLRETEGDRRITTWQYRVVEHTGEDGFVHHDIREVYRKGGKLSWTTDSKPPVGDTLKELKADLNMMLKACDLPVLEERGDTLVEVK